MQSLEDVPTWFSDYFDISLAAGQVFLSIIVILAVLLPVFILNRGNRGVIIEVVLLFVTMGALVGLGWLPFWMLVATVAVMALAVAMFGSKLVTGG